MDIQILPIEQVKPYVKNPRVNAEAVVAVKRSLEEYGFQQPLVLDKNMEIVVGHTRFKAAKEIGLKKVPCVVADNLSEDQVKAYRIMDNKSAEYAQWNYGLLTEEMQDLLKSDFDLTLTGFEIDELNDLGLNPDLDQFVETPLTDEDDLPEPKARVAKEGDVWQLGPHRLMCGDSTDFDSVNTLMEEQQADLIFTDPPYGLDFSGGRTQTVAKKEYGKILNDDLEGEELGNLIQNVWAFHKKDANIYICVSPIIMKPFLDAIHKAGKKVNAVIVWDKKVPGLGYMTYRRQCEFILYIENSKFKKGDTSDFDMWRIARDNLQEYNHGTQKPVALAQRAIENSSKTMDLVLDLFGGSGSTLLACEKTQRVARVMELDPMFVDLIITRYENYTGNEAVLVSHEDKPTYAELQKLTENG